MSSPENATFQKYMTKCLLGSTTDRKAEVPVPSESWMISFKTGVQKASPVCANPKSLRNCRVHVLPVVLNSLAQLGRHFRTLRYSQRKST